MGRAHTTSGGVLMVAVMTLACMVIAVLPLSASAAQVSVNTQQILPPGGNNGCIQPVVSGFTPYIYGSGMDSFEFTIQDASYVAIAASVGNTQVSFRYMSRRIDANGGVRVHADIPSTVIGSGLPVSVTLLSSRGAGQPVCASIVSVVVTHSQDTTARATPTVMTIQANQGPSVSSKKTTTTPVEAPVSATPGSSSAVRSPFVIASNIRSAVANACTSAQNAARLWLILLAAFIVLTGGLYMIQPSVMATQSARLFAIGVVVPLVLLLGLWVLLPACRAGWWGPVAVIIVAAAGLYAAYLKNPKIAEVLMLPQKQ